MRKIKIIALSIVAILGLTAAVFAFGKLAFNAKVSAKSETACCADKTCCDGGTCKMNGSCCQTSKQQIASTHEKNSCCNDANCCAGGTCKMNGSCCGNNDACPLKAKQTQTSANPEFDTNKVVVEEGEKSCCKGKMKMKS